MMLAAPVETGEVVVAAVVLEAEVVAAPTTVEERRVVDLAEDEAALEVVAGTVELATTTVEWPLETTGAVEGTAEVTTLALETGTGTCVLTLLTAEETVATEDTVTLEAT